MQLIRYPRQLSSSNHNHSGVVVYSETEMAFYSGKAIGGRASAALSTQVHVNKTQTIFVFSCVMTVIEAVNCVITLSS